MNKPNNKSGLFSRKVAHKTLINILENTTHLSAAFQTAPGFEELKENDKAFTKQLVMTTLRRYFQLEEVINSMMDRPLSKKDLPTKLWMMLGATQVLFMNVESYAAVNTIVENVGRERKGAIRAKKNLVNAILRNISRNQEKIKRDIDEFPENSLVPWLKTKWEKQFGKETLKAIASQTLNEPKLDLSFQSPKALEDFSKTLGGEIIKPATLRLTPQGPVENIKGFKSGLWWVQDIAASIPVHLLGDVKGKTVLDLCAAPGGKTLQLLSKGGAVTALDKSRPRVKRLKENLNRIGKKAEVIVKDALSYIPPNQFDIILLDAPCSATGTIRKHPDLMLLKDKKSISPLFEIQEKILSHAFGILKEGGTLIYCVCSLEQEEGIDQISNFLDKTPNAKRNNIENPELGDLSESLTPEGDALILPHHIKDKGGADGFFISRITKI